MPNNNANPPQSKKGSGKGAKGKDKKNKKNKKN